jgi:1-acyl-sn-glycerol-3-phosphate acyltransferase
MAVLVELAIAWLVLVLLVRLLLLPVLRRAPGGDPLTGLMWYTLRAFCRLVHSPVYRGMEELRGRQGPGPLIVVSNHTGALDPLLIQAACRFEIRWMMAEALMYPALAPLWRRQRIIPVARDGADLPAAREAIRHVRGGGVLGIFPEGRIVTPPRQVWPFQAGVGLIVARTGAPVLLVWVSGTPDTNVVSRSLFTPSRACVRFSELMRFGERVHAAQITAALRQRLHEISDWPLNDHPPPPLPSSAQAETGSCGRQ